MIPSGDFLFGAHCAFFGGVLAQEIEGKVGRGVAGAYAALVLLQGDVEHPVQGVFDAPVPADSAGQPSASRVTMPPAQQLGHGGDWPALSGAALRAKAPLFGYLAPLGSLLFSGVRSWPSTNRLPTAQALTRCTGLCPAPPLRRSVLPRRARQSGWRAGLGAGGVRGAGLQVG